MGDLEVLKQDNKVTDGDDGAAMSTSRLLMKSAHINKGPLQSSRKQRCWVGVDFKSYI